MNMSFVTRIILVIISMLIIIIIYKINKMIRLEKRISRYSLNNTYEDSSFFDKLINKYQKFTSKHKNNKKLIKYSKKYEKYLSIGERNNPITFIINKLLIALSFTLLVITSYAIRGKVVGLIPFLFSFILGYYIYDIYLIYKQKQDKIKIKNELLRAVIIMNNAFKAGKSTLQATEIASKELPKPISYEFKKIYQDMSYGLSADVAFNRFANRVKLEEATYIASSLTILNKTGGNIIMVFSSIERTLFDKKKLESDLKNSTAASNLVVKFLMIIPIIFVMVIYIVSPTYFEPFFASPLGYMILLILFLMFTAYIYLLNKIMKVMV